MSAESGSFDDEWNRAVRGEGPRQRADRNFIELLQELRVMQTGVQILFALLLTLAFTEAFGDADRFQRIVYVITLVCCAAATALLIAPVAYHRANFQQDRKAELVASTHRLVRLGLAVLVGAMAGALLLVLDEAIGRLPAAMISAPIAVLFLVLWFVLPAWKGRTGRTARAGRSDRTDRPGAISAS